MRYIQRIWIKEGQSRAYSSWNDQMRGGERMQDVGKLREARAWWREWHHSRYGVETAIRGTTAVVPTAGFHEEAATPLAAPPRLVVTPRGLCARACHSIYPLPFSWLDAFVVQRRSSGYLEQLLECRRDADVANFADLFECNVECAANRLRDACTKRLFAFPVLS